MYQQDLPCIQYHKYIHVRVSILSMIMSSSVHSHTDLVTSTVGLSSMVFWDCSGQKSNTLVLKIASKYVTTCASVSKCYMYILVTLALCWLVAKWHSIVIIVFRGYTSVQLHLKATVTATYKRISKQLVSCPQPSAECELYAHTCVLNATNGKVYSLATYGLTCTLMSWQCHLCNPWDKHQTR